MGKLNVMGNIIPLVKFLSVYTEISSHKEKTQKNSL